jgi:hypothetical protein
MYTPITKRVKVAQHKSSVAKSTEAKRQLKQHKLLTHKAIYKIQQEPEMKELTFLLKNMKVQMLVKTQTQLSAKSGHLKTKDANRTLMRKVVVVLKNLRLAQTRLEVLISNPTL